MIGFTTRTPKVLISDVIKRLVPQPMTKEVENFVRESLEAEGCSKETIQKIMSEL